MCTELRMLYRLVRVADGSPATEEEASALGRLIGPAQAAAMNSPAMKVPSVRSSSPGGSSSGSEKKECKECGTTSALRLARAALSKMPSEAMRVRRHAFVEGRAGQRARALQRVRHGARTLRNTPPLSISLTCAPGAQKYMRSKRSFKLKKSAKGFKKRKKIKLDYFL